MYELPYNQQTVVWDQDLDTILTQEYGVEFHLQQWAFDYQPVGQNTFWDVVISDDLSGLDIEDTWNDEHNMYDTSEANLNRLIDEWLVKAESNKNIASRPSENEYIDVQILLWRMCRKGVLASFGQVKVEVWW